MNKMESSLLDRLEAAKAVLATVCDPEIPVLTIEDLGILRDVQMMVDGTIVVSITPTYSGCPAMGLIEVQIRAAMQDAGLEPVRVETVLRPAWNTGWMSTSGREKLRHFGIAPPEESTEDKRALMGDRQVLACPHCGSKETEMLSQFGSTSCKALFRCLDCREPFDYFKCH
ncbi:MAG: phenylacetate-CoA oxygenase subunit PaaJ [Bacteroidetes bacterium]|nr:phenylacetate-CoA oxygenase subunit PaaJ [Bacteroidota bacterium]